MACPYLIVSYTIWTNNQTALTSTLYQLFNVYPDAYRCQRCQTSAFIWAFVSKYWNNDTHPLRILSLKPWWMDTMRCNFNYKYKKTGICLCPLTANVRCCQIRIKSVIMFWLCHQKQISHAGKSNCTSQYSAGCNYLSMPEIFDSGFKVLIFICKRTQNSSGISFMNRHS